MADYFTFNWGFWKSKQKFLMVKFQILTSVGGKYFWRRVFLLHSLDYNLLPERKGIHTVTGLLWASVWACVEGPGSAVSFGPHSELVRSAFLLPSYKRGTDRGTDWWCDLPEEVTVEARHQIRTSRRQSFPFATRPAFHSYVILSLYPYFLLVNMQHLALKNSIHVL